MLAGEPAGSPISELLPRIERRDERRTHDFRRIGGYAIERGVIAGIVTMPGSAAPGCRASGKERGHGAAVRRFGCVAGRDGRVCRRRVRCRGVAGQMRFHPRGYRCDARAQGTARRSHRPGDRPDVRLALAHPERDGLAGGLHRRPACKVGIGHAGQQDGRQRRVRPRPDRTDGLVSRSPGQEREQLSHAWIALPREPSWWVCARSSPTSSAACSRCSAT